MIFGQSHSPDAPVQSFGAKLAVAFQGAPDDRGNFLRGPHSTGGDSQQQIAREALKQFVVKRNDRLVAAGIALASRPPVQLTIDAARLVILSQDDVQAPYL